MSNDLVEIFLLSLLAMANPSLLAAVTVMLLLPSPKRLMLGYLLGAYITSITVGLLIVFTLHGSRAESASKETISPLEDILLAVLALSIAFVLRSERDMPLRERRREKRDAKLEAKRQVGKPTESLPLRMLGRGDPKLAFAVGIVLSFPGLSYLTALDTMHGLGAETAEIVLLVVAFCLIQQLFLEVPLLGYAFAPERTQAAIGRFKAWVARSGRTAAVIALTAFGLVLLVRAVISLV